MQARGGSDARARRAADELRRWGLTGVAGQVVRLDAQQARLAVHVHREPVAVLVPQGAHAPAGGPGGEGTAGGAYRGGSSWRGGEGGGGH